MKTLLFLAHRLPYPPNKGDKIRSYHWLRHLAQRYRILLGTFIDDSVDWQYLKAVKELCAEVHVEPIAPSWKRILSAGSFLTGEALTLPYFYSGALHRWVKEVVERDQVERAFAYSSPMAQYLLDLQRVRSVVDFVDMDSEKWGQYAQRRPWPVSAICRREARRLLGFEKLVASRVAASLFVTPKEAQLFASSAPECANRVAAIENGVDSEYFSPEHVFASPFAADEHPIVFTGTMDYWPNVDGVVWFARKVLPRIRERDPRARFHIVGMNPTGMVRALESDTAVSVPGRVADMRPYLRHARVAVAPIRLARGVQNKVLEAMAMERPVVATSGSAAGLNARQGIELEVADDASAFTAKVLAVMSPSRGDDMGRLARARILADYAWASRFVILDELLAGDRGRATRSHHTAPLRLTAASAR
ncbi:MAG TPA: TIGR03087 family PEP-CTERM/XrtA system glycosyltransferase [Casimicrobiaceae bacterium]|nr:TIGR03087 family PEP-CTERM/XrtA system glycosyltransferase [Casimicrobiaceae bacterium]